MSLNNIEDNLTLNNHPNRNYYIENYDMLVCHKCLHCCQEEELIVCKQCKNLFCEGDYYGRYALNQDTCLDCWVYRKCIFHNVLKNFKEFVDEVIDDGFLVDDEPADFIKPKNDYKFSNLMRILFNEYKIEYWDDDERRLKDRKKALIALNNTKTYLPNDVKRYLISNFL